MGEEIVNPEMEDKLEDEYWHPLFGSKEGLFNPILCKNYQNFQCLAIN